MLGDDAPVLGLGSVSQVKHRPAEPLVGGVAESQLGNGRDALATCPPRREFIAQLASGKDSTIDGPPAQATIFVLESNFQHAGRTPVGPALYPYAAWS